MKPNDDYTPQVGDLVQYIPQHGETGLCDDIGVIFKAELFTLPFLSAMMYHIQFPSEKLVLKPRFFKVIKKVDKNT